MSSAPPRDPAAELAVRLERMVETLAHGSAVDQAMTRAEAIAHADELRARVQEIVARVRRESGAAAERARLAKAVDKLVDAAAHQPDLIGKSVAQVSGRLKAAARARTIEQMAGAMALLASWLGTPIGEPRVAVVHVIEQMRAITRAEPFLDDARDAARLEAEVEAEIRGALEQIFVELKIRPPA